MNNDNKLSFEQAMKELEDIVRKLEDGELTLEESINLFQNGVKLSNQCSKMLDEVEHKVSILIKDKNGEVVERDFDAAPKEDLDEF
mgnify:CR=1 FL=1